MSEKMQSESLNALLRELAMSLKKLTHDETSLRELDATLDIARELHERIAILRFRAIEQIGNQEETPDKQGRSEEKGFEKPFSFSIRTEAAADTIAALTVDKTPEAPKNDVPPPVEVEPAPPAFKPAATEADVAGLSLADRLQLAPLAHLADAMGINDRVRFAQELYGGDMGAFKAACEAIESAQSEEAGLETMKHSADDEVDWAAEKGAAADFAVLVSRLFVGKPA